MKKFIINSICAFLVLGLQGCSKNVRDTWLHGNYDYFPKQYEGRSDSIAAIEARQALDSLSFYARFSPRRVYFNASDVDYNYYPEYDIFAHNGEAIIHDNSSDNLIGRISDVQVVRNKKHGKYDYILTFRITGRTRCSLYYFTRKIQLYIERGSDKVYCVMNGVRIRYGRIEPLLGPPERYREYRFKQELNPIYKDVYSKINFKVE